MDLGTKINLDKEPGERNQKEKINKRKSII
jgi:hypothetical protein